MPTVSIIVPVYNVEPFLRRCVDSILAQTFSDYELILVDDGSPDRCGEICDEYAEKDARVRVIHKDNGGAASARNAGLNSARGDYAAFVDSDDIVAPRWLEHLFHLADPLTLPLTVHCRKKSQLGKEKTISICAGERYPKSAYLLFKENGLSGYLTNALYNREILEKHHIRMREFPEKGDYNEDLLFALEYVSHINGIVYTGYADYYYKDREGSLSRSVNRYTFDKYAEKYRLWLEFAERENEKSETVEKELATDAIYHFICILRWENQLREVRRIVCSREMQLCLEHADLSKENPVEIKLIQKRAIGRLFVFYLLLRIKKKLTRKY